MGGGSQWLWSIVRSARLLTPLDLSKGVFLFLSVCASVGYHASSLRSLGHVVVLLLVSTEVPDIAGNEDVRRKT
jgi:hypothetical protein